VKLPSLANTSAGTETNVMALMVVAIELAATAGHGTERPPRKKSKLLC
jgi:hypothetical protein